MRRDSDRKPLIWGEHKAEYFFAQDWTGFRARRFFCLSGKSPRRGIQSFSSLQSVFYRLPLLCDGAIRGSPLRRKCVGRIGAEGVIRHLSIGVAIRFAIAPYGPIANLLYLKKKKSRPHTRCRRPKSREETPESVVRY